VSIKSYNICGQEEHVDESISELLCYHDIDPEVTLEVDVWEYKGKLKIQTYEDEGGCIDYYILTNADSRLSRKLLARRLGNFIAIINACAKAAEIGIVRNGKVFNGKSYI
jgi:hypothetical protein